MIMHVTATRTGRWWSLQCQEYPGAISQVTRLEQAADMMREAIAFVADMPEDSLEIDVLPVLPEQFLQEQDSMLEIRAQAKLLNSLAAEHARAAARTLADAGLPMRDIGTIMGISHQRAAQLVA